MNDDFNSPLLIGHLFDAVKFINSVKNKQKSISYFRFSYLLKNLSTISFTMY